MRKLNPVMKDQGGFKTTIGDEFYLSVVRKGQIACAHGSKFQFWVSKFLPRGYVIADRKSRPD